MSSNHGFLISLYYTVIRPGKNVHDVWYDTVLGEFNTLEEAEKAKKKFAEECENQFVFGKNYINKSNRSGNSTWFKKITDLNKKISSKTNMYEEVRRIANHFVSLHPTLTDSQKQTCIQAVLKGKHHNIKPWDMEYKQQIWNEIKSE